MNRRSLIKRLGQGALGAAAVCLGVQSVNAQPSDVKLAATVRGGEVVKAFVADYQKNGKTRAIITRDREWGI